MDKVVADSYAKEPPYQAYYGSFGQKQYMIVGGEG